VTDDAGSPTNPLALDALLAEESRLVRSRGGHAYREGMRADGVVVLPGFTMTRDEYAAALDAAEPWDRIDLERPVVHVLGDRAAVLRYRFTGLRGDAVYRADMLSTYELADGRLRLVTHQQTMEWIPTEVA